MLQVCSNVCPLGTSTMMKTIILLRWSTTSTFQLSMLEGNLSTGFHVQGTNHYTLYFSLACARELEHFFFLNSTHRISHSLVVNESRSNSKLHNHGLCRGTQWSRQYDYGDQLIDQSPPPCSSASLKELFPCSKEVTLLHKTSSFSNGIWTFLLQYTISRMHILHLSERGWILD